MLQPIKLGVTIDRILLTTPTPTPSPSYISFHLKFYFWICPLPHSLRCTMCSSLDSSKAWLILSTLPQPLSSLEVVIWAHHCALSIKLMIGYCVFAANMIMSLLYLNFLCSFSLHVIKFPIQLPLGPLSHFPATLASLLSNHHHPSFPHPQFPALGLWGRHFLSLERFPPTFSNFCCLSIRNRCKALPDPLISVIHLSSLLIALYTSGSVHNYFTSGRCVSGRPATTAPSPGLWVCVTALTYR